MVIKTPSSKRHEHALKFMFRASNNEAEYEALIAGLELCQSLGAEAVHAYLDSQPVVSQLNGEYEVKDDTMAAYVRCVREVTALLSSFEIVHIPHSENRQADTLSKLASSSSDGQPKRIE